MEGKLGGRSVLWSLLAVLGDLDVNTSVRRVDNSNWNVVFCKVAFVLKEMIWSTCGLEGGPISSPTNLQVNEFPSMLQIQHRSSIVPKCTPRQIHTMLNELRE